MAQVFLSYAHEDLPRVRSLVTSLEAEGYSVWWDRALQPGESFETTIDREIQAAQCVVVVWSYSSVNSQWVKNEALEGLDREVLIPISLDDIRLPVAFKQQQCANFKNWPQAVDPNEYRQFLSVLDRVLGADSAAERRELKGISHMRPSGRQRYRRRRNDLFPITVITALTILLATIWFLTQNRVELAKATPRLTIVPFASSNTPDEQFYADSMTREIIQRFSQFDDLELIQVGGLWNLDLTSLPQSIMQTESDYALSGDVVLSGGNVNLSVQLKDLASNSLIWKTVYSDASDNIFELQKKLVFGVLGQLNLASGDHVEMANLVSVSPDKTAYREYLRGIDLLRRGEQHHILSAIKRFETATMIDPNFSVAYAAMCRAYLERYRLSNATNDFDMAQKNCQQALVLNERQSDVQLAQAELYRTSGEADLARYHYTKLLELDPRSADANMGLADIFAQEGNYQSAEALYLKATHLRPSYWKAQNQLGSFYFRQGLYFQAMESYLRVTQLTTANATALNNLGAAQFYAGHFDQAYQSWLKASQFSTNSAAYSNMGTALYYAKRFDEALLQFEIAVKMDANDHRLWGNIGDILRFTAQDKQHAQDAYQQAIRLAEKNLTVNPTNATTHSRLAVYLAAIGDQAGAERQIGTFQNNTGADFNVLYDLAVATSLLGNLASSSYYIDMAREAGYPQVLLDSDPQFLDKDVL